MNSSYSKCIQTTSGITAFQDTCIDLKIVYFISGWHQYSLTGIIIFDAALAVPTIIMNVITVAVIVKNRSLQTVSNMLLASLATSDALTGIVTQPIICVGLYFILQCTSVCWLFVTAFQTGYYLAIVSFLTLTAVTLDRYIAILHPFRYQHWTITKIFIHRVVAITWLGPIIIVFISFATSRMWLQQVSLAILAPFSVGLSLYAQLKTIKSVKKARKRDLSVSVGPHDQTNYSKQKRRRNNSGKATKVATMILITTIICYIPQSVLTIIRMLQKDRFGFQGIYDWTKSLVLLSSTLNPIIYCFNMRDLRRKILQMICPCRNGLRRTADISLASFVISTTVASSFRKETTESNL